VVRNTGGLKDTVLDYGEPGGYGVTFNNAVVGDITHAIYRGVELFQDEKKFESVRRKMMGLDFSWDRSANEYLQLYRSLR
jgi:starch synthase